MESQNFKIPVSDWTEVGIENAKFVLSEAQSYLRYLSDVSGRITARAFSILTVLATITSALIAFVVKQALDSPSTSNFITYYTVAIVIALIMIMFALGKVVMPRLYMPVGRSPVELCNDEMLGVTLEKNLSLVALIMNEIENNQNKIAFNERQNAERQTLLNYCLKVVGVLFALSTVTITIYLCVILS
ncbi:MAG TPA: hypothetical protein VK174_09190 [Chitinophagales bacterium]|nr:hypothetical protein [Chitinophagales bacterium]